MTDGTYRWLFVRGPDEITLERITSVCLAVASTTSDRQLHDFGSAVSLLEFQAELHKHLMETGWDLEDFRPDRRTRRHDRRQTRTDAPDRRVLAVPVPRWLRP